MLQAQKKKERTKMQKLKNKTMSIVIALILMISMGASTMPIPTAKANTPPWTIPTYAFINVAPNPIGVNQPLNVIMWIDKPIPGAAIGNNIRWHNYNLTITLPDGTTQTTIFPVCTDTTSAQYYSYTPTQVGKYTFTFTFPVTVYTYTGSQSTGDTYLPSSASTTLTVQQEPITAIYSYPLPEQYWTRPIYGENTDWWSISSNWLGELAPGYAMESYTGVTNGDQQLNPFDAIGPQTSHVMWTKPLQSGGVVGGNELPTQGDTYFDGSCYLWRFANPIILDGMLYYTEPISFAGANNAGGTSGPTDCVDLRTGQLVWSSTTIPALSFGLIYDVQNVNQHGVCPPILVATSGGFGAPTTWMGYDADTGTWLFNATNVPSGAAAMGPNGEYIIYVMANDGTPTNPHYYLSEWNSSNLASAGFPPLWFSQISGTVDASASSCYDWNVSIPWLNTMPTTTPGSNPATVIATYYNDMLLCYNGTLPNGGAPAANGPISSSPYTYFAVNLNASKGTVGSILWMQTYNAPPGNITIFEAGADRATDVFVEYYHETMQWVGYSMDTGARLWGPVGNETALDYYGNQQSSGYLCNTGFIAYSNLYYMGFGGILYCYNAKTGALLWTYGNGGSGNSTNAGYQNAYGDYPTYIEAIGNGIIYTVTTEHTITTPIYKGALARAINATDGKEIWTLSAYTGGGHIAIADGFEALFNSYDNQIYTVGRGPSATTVEAPKAAITLGGSLVISGTVTDVSAGTTQNQQAADFPNGVPVASDASMTDWMGYVYQQKPLPTNFTGVPVTIDVLDSNNNYRNIGNATTDASGAFSYQWAPDISGKYTVIATFAGTNGYWPSYSETSFAVDPAAPTASPYPVVNLPPTEMYFAISTVAIIIAIAIGFAITILMLRKRP